MRMLQNEILKYERRLSSRNVEGAATTTSDSVCRIPHPRRRTHTWFTSCHAEMSDAGRIRPPCEAVAASSHLVREMEKCLQRQMKHHGTVLCMTCTATNEAEGADKEVVERSGDTRRCGVSPRRHGGAGGVGGFCVKINGVIYVP